MKRNWLTLVVAVSLSAGQAITTGQDKVDDKKPAEKEEKEFGKTISEWIALLRNQKEDPKFRRASLIVLEATAKAGTTGLPAVLDCVEKDTDASVRQQAVILLGRLGPEKRGTTLALVDRLQNDADKDVREAAATALGSKMFLGQAPQYLNILIDRLKDKHAGTRVAIVSTMRNMEKGAAPAVPALIDAAKNADEHELVRTGAVHIISRYGSTNPQTLTLFVEIVNKSDNPTALREAAIDGLARTAGDSTEALAALSKSLVEKNLEIRKAAATTLHALGAKAQPAWTAVKTRFDKKNEPDSGIRNNAIRLAGVLGKTNDEAVDHLALAAEKDDSNENRIAAIQELGELGSRAKSAAKVLDAIRKEDGRATIREAAEKALKQIR